MNETIASIVIVGGGTAGWITAGTLASKFKNDLSRKVNITLIESSQIQPVGVGEGTWPTMRKTLANMGIAEADFLRECNATFKQGSTFNGWRNGQAEDTYHHPFSLPADFHKVNLAWHWMVQDHNMPFAELVSPQSVVIAHGLAPKTQQNKAYEGVLNYGYHLDAGAFSHFLRKHCLENLHINHIVDDVIKVDRVSANLPRKEKSLSQKRLGDIVSVLTLNHGEVKGDLFVDCSGQQARLIGQCLEVPFISHKNTLFIDSALAVQVPYANGESKIDTTTRSTAQSAGWIWDIGLQHRRGVGYAYSSQHIDENTAKKELLNYFALDTQKLTPPDQFNMRKLTFEPGHRAKFWQNNCVAIGLSAGFVEPLEASSLALVELSANYIAEQFPLNRNVMENVAQRFNEQFLHHWQSIIDFLKLHYVLSERLDSPFWRQNKRSETIPETLKEKLSLWKYKPPWHQDFVRNEVFPAASYQYVMCGMGFKSDVVSNHPSIRQKELAVENFNYVQQLTGTLLQELPHHKDVLERFVDIK